MRAGWGEADFRLVSPTFLDAIRHALFAERCKAMLDDLAEVRGMSDEGMSLQNRAKLGGMKVQAQKETDQIRALLFPADDEPEGGYGHR